VFFSIRPGVKTLEPDNELYFSFLNRILARIVTNTQDTKVTFRINGMVQK